MKNGIGNSSDEFHHCLSGEVLVLYPCSYYWGKLVGNTKGTGRDFSKGLFLGAEDSGAAGQTLELLACGMSCRIYRASNKQIRRT